VKTERAGKGEKKKKRRNVEKVVSLRMEPSRANRVGDYVILHGRGGGGKPL